MQRDQNYVEDPWKVVPYPTKADPDFLGHPLQKKLKGVRRGKEKEIRKLKVKVI